MSARLEHLDAEEVRELRRLFLAQSGELLEQMQETLVALERDGLDGEGVRLVKRALHTVKGDATSMGFEAVGLLCHRLEDVLAIAAAEPPRAAAALETLFAGADSLAAMLAALAAGEEPLAPAAAAERCEAFLRAERAPAGLMAPLSPEERLEAAAATGRGLGLFFVEAAVHPGCREREVGALLLRERLRAAGTVLACRPDPEREGAAAEPWRFLVAAGAEAPLWEAARLPGVVQCATVLAGPGAFAAERANASGAGAAASASERTEVLRVDAAKVDRVLDLASELVIGRSMLEQVAREAAAGVTGPDLAERLAAASAAMDRAVGDLQRSALRMRMVPLRYVFKKFPRVVRDLAHQLGKRAHLEIEGQETELDKGIVDQLFEPLTHLVRNMVGHGVEGPAERAAAGKPPEGLITMRAYQEGAHIVIEVGDDGRGIDSGRLVARALERGLLDEAAAAALSEEERLRLIFASGVSTAEQITETSGRGVGMDAVKSALEAVKGTVEIESRPGRGTRFRLRLPLTLAVVRTLLFDAGGRLYALPVAAIAEVARIRPGELTSVDGRPCLRLREQVVSVVELGGLLGGAPGGAGRYVLVLALRGRRVGLLVDTLRWQQELVVRPVDGRWVDAGVVAGASILGDGGVVLILDAFAVVARSIETERVRSAS